MFYTVPHYINGKAEINESTQSQPIYNPAQGIKIGQVHIANDTLCEKAIQAARQAWKNWAETSTVTRTKILFRFRELLEKNHNDLSKLVNQEHGKTIEDAKGSVARGIEVVEYNCGLITQLQGVLSTNVSSQVDCYTLRQPLGVCAGVSPFNFPIMVPIWMMIPAIASGNTFILKPSEQDPSSTLRLFELLHDAGLPDGVANCIHGDKSTVDYLLEHPEIQAFTAVASTPVAKSIYQKAIATGKRAQTFGGAKNHGVVMPDADLAQTASAIIGAAFGSAGERCMAISVVVAVGEHTADMLLQHMQPLIQAIKIDAGNGENCDMGPVISESHKQRIIKAIDTGINEGAHLIIDGRNYQHALYPKGFFVGPTLFDHVTESMSIYQNEIFGPVLAIVRVHDFDEALALVNRNQYGNGTAIFTRDGFTAREYSQKVQAGMVGINIPIPVPIANHPFGGWKNSVFGDTNMHGLESIHFYTKLKTITSKWPTNERVNHSFIMPHHG